MVVDGAYPNDIRVRKEAESLVENGKKVLVVCPSKKGLLKNEVVNGVTIHRIGNDYTTWKRVFVILLKAWPISIRFFM